MRTIFARLVAVCGVSSPKRAELFEVHHLARKYFQNIITPLIRKSFLIYADAHMSGDVGEGGTVAHHERHRPIINIAVRLSPTSVREKKSNLLPRYADLFINYGHQF